MASTRTAGVRAFARLAACVFSVFSVPAFARDTPPEPFVEYEGDDRFSTLVNEAAVWQMEDTCEWEGFYRCDMVESNATEDGWESRWHYERQRAGGEMEFVSMRGGGSAYYGCPDGFELYVVAFGFPAGPYPNRTIDVGGPYQSVCKAVPAHAVAPVIGRDR